MSNPREIAEGEIGDLLAAADYKALAGALLGACECTARFLTGIPPCNEVERRRVLDRIDAALALAAEMGVKGDGDG